MIPARVRIGRAVHPEPTSNWRSFGGIASIQAACREKRPSSAGRGPDDTKQAYAFPD